jgi:predicted RNA-binding Zn-ribbon protein involved in translation (DUF1610 family)
MSNDSAEYKALVERWDGFLEKIKSRYNEVIDSSREPLKDMIGGLQYDSIVIHNTLQGIKNQSVYQLDKKINESWEKMEGEMEKIGVMYDYIVPLRQKTEKTSRWMWDEFERFSITTFADAARQIEKNIRSVVDENVIHNCISCGSQLPVEVWAFQAVNVKCPNCGSVNTYEPDGRVRQLEGVYSAYADEFAMEERILKDKDNKNGAAYFKKYYGFIIEKLPQRKEYYERIMNDKLNNPDFVGK